MVSWKKDNFVYKDHLIEGTKEDLWEVGLTHSSEETSNDRGVKGLAYIWVTRKKQ
jgi:hypothetical protein